MTKKQRHEIYKKALKNYRMFDGLCYTLDNSGFGEKAYYLDDPIIKTNPAKEFTLFKPLEDYELYFPCDSKTREIVLEFLIQMTA